ASLAAALELAQTRGRGRGARTGSACAAALLYADAAAFVRLVRQVLAMDVRSARERRHQTLDVYRVTLCGIVVRYRVVRVRAPRDVQGGGKAEDAERWTLEVEVDGGDVEDEATRQPQNTDLLEEAA
ncbi:hypothetical protein HK405_000308, partial [Cladochytrium tenue]